MKKFGSGIRDEKSSDPGSWINIQYPQHSLNQKIVTKVSEYDRGCLYPIPDQYFFHPRSQIQGSKRHRISEPDLQNWVPVTDFLFKKLKSCNAVRCRYGDFNRTYNLIDKL
jgi:hypothetical protein